MACVDVPALPLQLLLFRQPEWRRRPVAVVEDDSPLSPLLWVNEASRRVGILPGLRYAAGLSLDHRLCAGTVSRKEIDTVVERVHRLLLRFSPEVEPAADEPGIFWLNAAGLDRLHGSLESWAERIEGRLRRHRFVANITVGFTRFGSYTLVRVRRGVHVLASAQAEYEASRRVSLARLGLDPRLRDDLAKLGIRTVAEFLVLPAAGIRKRFGAEAERLHRLARGELFDPLRPHVPAEPDRIRHFLDDPEDDAWRLLFLIKRLTHPLLSRLADRRQAVAKLHLLLKLADRRRHHEVLQPATATLDMVLLMELVRLRLENLKLKSGVEIVTIELDAVDAPPATRHLFRRQQRRDRAAALRALARIRAEFGDDAVVHAELRSGHLPEAGFGWTPVHELKFPEPVTVSVRPLIRRILVRPQPLTKAQQRRHLVPCGLYALSGGWWRREVRRVYHFVETGRGELLWIYYDQYRRQWFLHGTVE